MLRTFSLLLFCLFMFACQPQGERVSETTTAPSEEPSISWDNPAAADFNAADSDPTAIALADSVMYAMGGRRAWDDSRFFRWNFFGRRILLWDKQANRVRIDVPEKELVYLINVAEETGQIWKSGEAMSHPDSLDKYISRGKSIWINDSYWLVMPFKLKDSGVTLKDLGQGNTANGEPARILQLTFQDVGDTPQNKYHIYVNPKTQLVSQWDYYGNATDEEPGFSLPWQNYQAHGPLLLSGDRGKSQLTNVALYEEVPDEAFTEVAKPDISAWPTKD